MKRRVALLLALCLAVMVIPAAVFAADPLPAYAGEWTNFRGNAENMGIVNAPLATGENSGTLKWGVKMGTGWDKAPTPPLIVNGDLYVAIDKKVVRMDKETGKILQESKALAGSVGFALNAITYAEGMFFVQIGNGRVQALRADTLESLWISEAVGGQTLTPVAYHDGYVYYGTWNRQSTKDGVYVCLNVKDEDTSKADEVKKPVWMLVNEGGFYWAGAYVTDQYIVFGSDTGVLYSCDPKTGKVLDTVENMGDHMRSSISYDKETDRLYFTTKSGKFHSIRIGADGKFNDSTLKTLEPGGMMTSTPLVYKGRAYIGVGGSQQFDPNGGHAVKVVDVSKLDQGGEMTVIYSALTPGYVQASSLMTTSYEEKTGKVYIYLTYNAPPGGIYVMEDSAGQTKANIYSLFTPSKEMQQYSISTLVADAAGTIYYKNDSCYLMAITKAKTAATPGNPSTAPAVAGFTDVKADSWYAAAVSKLSEQKLIKGTSATTFSPESNITRAEFIQILYNKEGAPQMVQAGGMPFSDVKEEDWYGPAVKWAFKNGVVSGTEDASGNVRFNPNANISRQDMAVMLNSYLTKVAKIELTEKNAAVTFADGTQIEAYAKTAVTAMQKAGIISGQKGKDGAFRFAPAANATRAEAASMVSNFVQ